MVNPETRKQYIATIGIECHVQLKTRTKLFAAVQNDAREAPANTLISHICLGMPGALPVLNEQAVALAARAAFALGTEPRHHSSFDRKHYFYPDLPKGYQITQYQEPVIAGGSVTIPLQGGEKTVRITRAHLEEDAGKSSHPVGKDYSLVDLNRAGTPLLEIVSEPDMHSAEEAKAYARELWLLMRYAGVSDADLYYGNMRFDVNVSVSNQAEMLGTRTETKNLNSFRSVEKAVEYEITRQITLLEKGEAVIQETRGWDDAKQKTFSQRSKEEAHDYRYFPDPDLPPVVLDEEDIAAMRAEPLLLPWDVRKRLSGLGLDDSLVETLVEQQVAATFIWNAIEAGAPDTAVKRIAVWLAGEAQALVAAGRLDWNTVQLDLVELRALSEMVEADQLSSTGAKAVLHELLLTGGKAQAIAQTKDLLQVSDESEMEKIVQEVIDAHPAAADDVRNGEAKAIGFLIGQVMKRSQGKANPQMAGELIKKLLT